MLLLALSAFAAEPDEDEPEVARDLPVARYTSNPPVAWIGVTPPTFGKPASAEFESFSLGIEANVRFGLSVAWLAPEVRIAFDQGLDVFHLGRDRQVMALIGLRFGREQGFYGGLAGGTMLLHQSLVDDDRSTILPAVLAYGGYAFPAGKRMRVSPELSLGVRNTVALRLEWGV